MNELELVFPAKKYKGQVMEYLQEHFDNNEFKLNGVGGLDKLKDFDKWLELIKKQKKESVNGFVPATLYLAIRKKDNKIVGMIHIRHFLNDYLLEYGGHIGYGVRPSERKKGHAKEMLKLALEICKDLNINKALLTCDKSNIYSSKVITYNGGVLENEVVREDGKVTQRYWIKI